MFDGVVRLRMQGSCHGCPSSAMTLKNAIEEAIYAAVPDVTAIEVEGIVDPTGSPRALSFPLCPWIPGLPPGAPALPG